jgi:hypothetical protein
MGIFSECSKCGGDLTYKDCFGDKIKVAQRQAADKWIAELHLQYSWKSLAEALRDLMLAEIDKV